MKQQKNEVLPGTLNLMVLNPLSTLGSLHGYEIARRIEQISGNILQLNQGTMYPSLLHLGKKQLAAEEESWRRASESMFWFREPSEENT